MQLPPQPAHSCNQAGVCFHEQYSDIANLRIYMEHPNTSVIVTRSHQPHSTQHILFWIYILFHNQFAIEAMQKYNFISNLDTFCYL